MNHSPYCFPSRLLIFAGLSSFLSAAPQPSIHEHPEDNRFTKVIVADKLDEPMATAFLPGGNILIVERRGNLKLFNSKTGTTQVVETLPVNTSYTDKNANQRQLEEGLMGVIAHPNFKTNHWIYLYYADPQKPAHVLARWDLINDKLEPASKRIVLEVPVLREEFCCAGGSMAFDAKGNLYLAVGTNSVFVEPETAGAGKDGVTINTTEPESAGNSNDLRGKILRIKPLADGSYEIPPGNLFPPGTDKTKPEIYIMGTRNPWRISIDSKTGFLYWADPGRDEDQRHVVGTRGLDEFNQAKQAGNFGWPFYVGVNQPYYASTTPPLPSGQISTPGRPLNPTPKNSGLAELPRTESPLIWYPYGLSEKFHLLGTGGRSAVGGPVYHRADHPDAVRPFPDYYEGKWFISDFMRGWIMAVSIDENGSYQSMEKFLPKENFGSAIDMNFSPDGDLYVLEYGTKWLQPNDNARLVRIEYHAGNRKPKVAISADKPRCAVPTEVTLSSSGTEDPDNDALSYEWLVTGSGMTSRFNTTAHEVLLTHPGAYQVQLTVTDFHGAKSSASMELLAGNAPPQVSIDTHQSNQTFFFPNETLEYAVNVSDEEDGSLADGRIASSAVLFTIDYLPVDYDLIASYIENRKADMSPMTITGDLLTGSLDCKACHTTSEKSIGPSYIEIAKRYQNDPQAFDRLTERILKGGSGVWGQFPMSAHPDLPKSDARAIVAYILAINDRQSARSLPLNGEYKLSPPPEVSPYGSFLMRAAFMDKGTKSMSPQITESLRILRFPVLYPDQADFKNGTHEIVTPAKEFMIKEHEGHIGFKAVDLTGISEVLVTAYAVKWTGALGGTIECRLDSPTGTLAGRSGLVEVSVDKEKKKNAFDFRNSGIKGTHDLFFVFKNEQVPPNQPLMQVRSVEFKKD